MYRTVNPYTGSTSPAYPFATDAELLACVAQSETVFEQWKAIDIKHKARLLTKLAELLKNFKFSHATTITRETGKLLREAVAEVEKCADLCEYYADRAEQMLKPEIIKSDASHSEVRYEPLGGIAVFMPWNFPFWQVFRSAVPALMAGNTVVLKHAYNVPACALEIIELFEKVGFAPGAIQNIFLAHEKSELLISHPFIKAVSITGSEAAGATIGSLAGKYLKKCVAELGGSDPFILLENTDVQRAAQTAFASRMICAGQSCIAAKRFIVHKKHYHTFLQLITEKITQLQIGNPEDDNSTLAPLASAYRAEALRAQVQKAISQGATMYVEKILETDNKAYFAPCVLTDFATNNPAWLEEFFGPVFSVLCFEEVEEALQLANASAFGLGASVWTDDAQCANALIPQLRSGNVFVNGIVKSQASLPFGGINRSGYGRELSVQGIREFVNIKTVWIA